MPDQFDSLKGAIIAGDQGTSLAITNALVATGTDPNEILDKGLMPGMDVVGQRMKVGECFIPEVLLSARTMQACLNVLKPLLASGVSRSFGTVVIGTVEGDVHDIGKSIVALMLEGAGFTVIDLGAGVNNGAFVAAVEEHGADILGMSALLTTTMPRMAEVIEALKAAGLRDQVKVMIGGAPVNRRYADEIGADGMGANAVLAVEKAKELVRAVV